MDIVLPPVADPVGEALQFLRINGTFYCRSEFTAPWGLELPPMNRSLMMHVVTSGRCWLEVPGSPPRLLNAGHLALIPHVDGHRMSSQLGVPTTSLCDVTRAHQTGRYELIRMGGGGEPANLVCSVFQYDHPAAEHLVQLLPRVIVVDACKAPHSDWMHSTLRLMEAEAREMCPASATVVTRLSDILVIQAVRCWIFQEPAAQTGWLGALRDPQIGRTVARIHREPEHPWTLESLAAESAMSRSAFAARFTELVGEPAMHYVARWRMLTALTWLREGDSTVGEIARRLNYESEAAFNRAFRRFLGITPGSARRTAAAAAATR